MPGWLPDRFEQESEIAKLRADNEEKALSFVEKIMNLQPVEQPLPFEPQTSWVESFLPKQRAQTITPEREFIIPPRLQAPPPVSAPVAVAKPEAPVQAEPKWWEQPKIATEQAMTKVGEAAVKVPFIKGALEKASPFLNWVHENLDLNWAATITAPFSPSLSWQKGESWFAHQKREYEAWQAPTYIKGVAEFLNPVFFIPYAGWAAKGGRALGLGEKTISVMRNALTPSKILTIPSKEVLNRTLYQPDFYRRLAYAAEKVPGIKQVVEFMGGPAAFVRGDISVVQDITTRAPRVVKIGKVADRLALKDEKLIQLPLKTKVNRELLDYSFTLSRAQNNVNLKTRYLQGLANGNSLKLAEMDDVGRALAATPKTDRGRQLGQGFTDVVENLEEYTFKTPQAEKFFHEFRKELRDFYQMLDEQGIKRPKGMVLHRLVKGQFTESGDFEKTLTGSKFGIDRVYDTMEQGITAAKPVVYSNNPLEYLEETMRYYYRKIAEKRFTEGINELGMTLPEKIGAHDPDLMDKIAQAGATFKAAKQTIGVVADIQKYKGAHFPGRTISKIRESLPDLGNQLDELMSVDVPTFKKLMVNLRKDIRLHLGIKEDDLIARLAVMMKEPRIRMSTLKDVIETFVSDENKRISFLTRVQEQVYGLQKAQWDDGLKALRESADTILNQTRTELKPLRQRYAQYVDKYTKGSRQILGEGEMRFGWQASTAGFGGRIFPAEVVQMVEKRLAPSSKALAGAAQVSGASRMLTATLDFSASVIQGLVLFGRNPIAWGKSVGQMFRFAARPEDFYKVLNDPVNRIVSMQRVMAGGSIGSFEFFESLPAVQKALGKIPVVGKPLKAITGQAFGRAEAAFTGFGELARNELWKSHFPNQFSKWLKTLTPEQRLHPEGKLIDDFLRTPEAKEIARSIDRMTGVMSVEELGQGMSQKNFETAWLFFAPRYTRAGMAFVGDIFKGGFAGAEARKGLGSMLAAGMLYYNGISRALGQEPNLDPSSAKFMTVRIGGKVENGKYVGGEYVGLGGIYYSLTRLLANVVATAEGDEPLDLVRLSRFDNPFIKFMYNRTAPLTSTVMGAAIEQKNFFGEPLESPKDWARFMADKITPIALQRVLSPETDQSTKFPLFVAEEMGGRTFPMSAWEQREEAREKYAQQNFGASFEELSDMNKAIVDQNPEIISLAQEADERAAQTGKVVNRQMAMLKREKQMARKAYIDYLSVLETEVTQGFKTPFEFKELMITAKQGLRQTYTHIESQPEYAKAMEKYNEPRQIDKKFIEDIAYEELRDADETGQFEDQFGIFDFDRYNAIRKALKAKYGDTVWAKVEERELLFASKDLPPLAQEFEKAKQVLRPYWEVADEMKAKFGETWAMSSRGQSIINKVKKLKRLRDPQIAYYYSKFYDQSA